MLNLTAGWARLIRGIVFSGISAAITATLAQVDVINEQVTAWIDKIPNIDSPEAMAVIVIAGLTASLQAADKALRDGGYIPDVLEK